MVNRGGSWTVSAPASSANLGPGFDALALALGRRAVGGVGAPPDGARAVESTHPAAVAHRAAGGDGELWIRAPIPMGRGLGFSGAVRVVGAGVALAASGVDGDELRRRSFSVAAELEGHADNAAASAFGGLVVSAGGHVVPVPVGVEAEVVVWIPSGTTSTDRSRRSLPRSVPFVDAVHNVGRTALLVAALTTGRVDVLADATEDRLHQAVRTASVPGADEALGAARDAGAWASWLSGSGPTVAALVPAGTDDVDGPSTVGAAVLSALASVTDDAVVARFPIDPLGVSIHLAGGSSRPS